MFYPAVVNIDIVID
uniref:Uncharacterized protein n=1 Tax=Arundo donax TaxID=35708 RepID=A0A0A9FY43_ARUDO